MSTMAEVIRTVLARGAYQMPGDKLPYETMAEHVAAELAAAGYGNKADAWGEGHAAGKLGLILRTEMDNPYGGAGHE